MIFRREEIGGEGLSFEISKNGRWLTNISEISENTGEIKMLSPVFFSMNVEKTGAQISVSGSLSFDILSPCSRCLSPAKSGISRQIAIFLEAAEKGKIIDISDDMREQVAMAMPEKLICANECKGLCPRCGADLNEGVCACKDGRTEAGFHETRFKILKETGIKSS